jgi:hypothetical protein
MPANLGYAFAPGADQQLPGGQNGQGRQGMSPQDAVKLLSLRVPERPAAGGIAPQALLQGQGAAGMGGGGLQAIIRALMSMQGGGGAQGMMGGGGMGGGGGLPTPRVIPGIGDGAQGMPTGGAQGFNITPEMLQQFMNRPLDPSGRTLGGGGGFGGNAWSGGQMPQQQTPAPPLF